MFKQVIYYFMAVVEEGIFSKAAKKYYLSQSAISQQITKLEKDLGFSLFNRKTYCPTLTKEGKRYYDLAKRLIDDYNNEYEDIKENLQKDVLTIGITGPFEKQHIPFIVRSFKENHDVSIDIKAFNLLTCMEKLNEREIKVYQYILAHSLEFPFMTIRELADKYYANSVTQFPVLYILECLANSL